MSVEWIISCPVCGRQIMKSGGCMGTTISCPKCGSELMFNANSSTVHIQVIRMSPKQKKTA